MAMLPILNPTITVRTATPEDIPHVHAIYSHYVLHTATDLHHVPPSLAAFTAEYETSLALGLPHLVAVTAPDSARAAEYHLQQVPPSPEEPGAAGPVLGFIHATPFRGHKVGYARTVELAIMCHPGAVQRGVGSALMQAFLAALERRAGGTTEQVLAFMTVLEDEADDQRVKGFYEKWGFREVGRLEDVGQKFGRRCVVFLKLNGCASYYLSEVSLIYCRFSKRWMQRSVVMGEQ